MSRIRSLHSSCITACPLGSQCRRIPRFHFCSFSSSSVAVADSLSPDSPKPEGFLVHLAGHILLFERRRAPDFDASVGMRLLAVAIVVEAIRLVAVKGLYPAVPLVILVLLFLVCALLLVRFVAGVRVWQVGGFSWRGWDPG